MEDTNRNLPQRQLSLLQWNCRAIRNKIVYLTDYLNTHPHIDVLMLQSLNATKNQLPKLRGYWDPVTSTEGNKVMTATYVSNRLQYEATQELNIKTESRLFISLIKLKATRQNINILNLYYPNSCNKTTDLDWLQDLNTTDDSWIIGGDFNTSHPTWDAGQPDNSGQNLADAVANTGLLILNDGSFTRLGNTGQRNSAIDLTLVTPDLFKETDWTTGTDHLQSDHLPIHTIIQRAHPTPTDIDQTPKYQYSKADWDKFSTQIEVECLQKDPIDQDIDTYYENIRGMILRAADTAIPKRSPTMNPRLQHRDAWWNEECSEAKRKKQHTLAACKKNQSETNHRKLDDATKHFKEMTDKAKKEHWEQFLSQEVHDYRDTHKVWEKISHLRKSRRHSEQALLVNGKPTTNNKEKADALAETFAKTSQSKHLPSLMHHKRQREEAKFTRPTPDNTTIINSDIKLQELESAINGIKNTNKATGTDPISYNMIRHLPHTMLLILLAFYQTCWNTGAVPSAWKSAVVIGIHKDGKPKTNPESYRPISLTSHLGKTYEHIMKHRLEYHLEKNNIIPTCQAGFRRGRQCIEHVVHLMEDTKTWIQRGNRTTAATFFDIKKAFDTVWHAKLLDKLNNIGITGRMYDYIATFLHSRKITVKVGSAFSTTHTVDMGIPQGSVIAPILFSVMLHDIQHLITDKSKSPTMSLYADDLALWINFSDRGSVQHMADYQRHIDKVSKYMTENGFELSPEKTSFMVFNRNRNRQHDYSIKLGNKTILPSKQVKFLGVTITTTLTWTSHLTNLQNKASRSVNLIKSLTRETWASPGSLVQLTNALVRSRLTYGLEVFITASQTQWQTHQRIELCALKHALGVCRRAINDLVYQEAGWLPLKDECLRRCANFEARMAITTNNVKTSLGQQPTTPQLAAFRRRWKQSRPALHQKTTTLSDLTNDLWTDANIKPADINPNPPTIIPPWTMEKPTIITEYATNATKKDNPLYIATVAKETLHTRYQHHLQIYTDGSVLDSGEAGCAMVIPSLKVSKKVKFNKGVSIYSAEIYALYIACDYLNSLPNPPLAAVILTDSKSSLQALNSNRKRNNRPELQAEIQLLTHQIITKGTDLTLHWLPSHCGIAGNEKADRTAKAATTSGRYQHIGLSLPEAVSKLRNVAHNKRNDQMQDRCKNKGWIHIPLERQPTKQKLPFPRKHQQVIRRIRTGYHRYLHLDTKCRCGAAASLSHALSTCPDLPDAMAQARDYRIRHQLQIQDLLAPHTSLGFMPMRMLADGLLASGLVDWF